MKNIKRITIPALLSLCLLSACQTDTGKSGQPVAPESSTPAAASTANMPGLFLYLVNVDNLRLREEPNLSAGVTVQLKEGEIVEGSGEKSANEDEVALRGISIKAPYYRVTSTTTGNPSGWAFGGALLQVYAGSRTGAPNRQPITDLAVYLKGLNTKSADSGGKAWAYAEQHFSTATGPLADAAFVVLEQFFRRLEREGAFYTLTEKVNWSDQDMNAIYEGSFDPGSKHATRSLAANGFRIVTAEGAVFPIVDCRKFQTFFAGKTTPGMAAYINQRTEEQNKPMFDDGGVIIPLEKVADQAVFWEKFNRDNPWFPLREETQHSETWMRLVLLNGSDNTPAFNYETDEIDEEFKNVWAYIQQKYPGTELAKAVKQMADLCAAENWKRTQKVEAYRNKVAEQLIQ